MRVTEFQDRCLQYERYTAALVATIPAALGIAGSAHRLTNRQTCRLMARSLTVAGLANGLDRPAHKAAKQRTNLHVCRRRKVALLII